MTDSSPLPRVDRSPSSVFAFAAFVTVVAALMWLATGRHVFTKYESIDERPVVVAADDPFAAAGFYDGEAATEVVRGRAFHFGLLPAPQSALDKHVFSVSTVVTPLWLLALAVARRRRFVGGGAPATADRSRPFTCPYC